VNELPVKPAIHSDIFLEGRVGNGQQQKLQAVRLVTKSFLKPGRERKIDFYPL
jgi:hypothetical protein